MHNPSTDELFLRRALDLARQGVGLTSPNPCVCAVIVDANRTMVGKAPTLTTALSMRTRSSE